MGKAVPRWRYHQPLVCAELEWLIVWEHERFPDYICDVAFRIVVRDLHAGTLAVGQVEESDDFGKDVQGVARVIF